MPPEMTATDPPKPGERNSFGETWDGQGWLAPSKPSPAASTVDKPASFGILDAIPGLRDVLNLPINLVKGAQAIPDVARNLVQQPTATLKGFTSGASEAATPGRVGLLALLTGGATLPAALGAGGAEALAQGARLATDAPNAPQSLSDAAVDVTGAASVPAIAGALNAVPGAVTRLGGAKKLGGRIIGAGLGGYEGYKHDGLSGAVLGAGMGAAAPDLLRSAKMKALRVALGLGGSDAAANEIPAETQLWLKPDTAEAATESAPPLTRAAWEARKANDFPYQRSAAPTMPTEPDQNPAELYPYQREALPSRVTTSGVDYQDPRDPLVEPSIQSLNSSLADPAATLKDEAVSRYLNQAPNSAFSRLRADQSDRDAYALMALRRGLAK